METLEYAKAEDTYCDFMLWKYAPVAPAARKLRTASLLFHSFDFAGLAPHAFDLVQVIRQGIGELNTVWGVKQIDGRLAWEFYFYDYRRRERQRSVSRLMGHHPALRRLSGARERTTSLFYVLDRH
jgi:hypothetical protein